MLIQNIIEEELPKVQNLYNIHMCGPCAEATVTYLQILLITRRIYVETKITMFAGIVVNDPKADMIRAAIYCYILVDVVKFLY